MDIQILVVPYDSGRRGARMGAGPERLIEMGIQAALTESGHRVHASIAELPDDSWQGEIQSGFALMRMLAAGVTAAREAGRLPIILAGNCNTSVGIVAGIGREVGVAWFDAHGDFNTPETTTSGFLDGTALATLTGRCWSTLARTVPGFVPVRESRVCLIGTRDMDPAESELLADSAIQVLPPAELRMRLPRVLAAVGEHVDGIYVHIDLDVLDASVAKANSFAASGGLTIEDVEFALSAIAARFHIAAITLSAYDPASDADGRAAAAAVRLLQHAAGAASTS